MNLKFQLANHGFEICEQGCPAALLERLRAAFAFDAAVDWELLDSSPLVRREADSGIFQKLAADVLGAGCFATHAILYNKTAANNAAQPWHQDTTVKAEGGFVEAPDEVTFAKLLSLRLSLDDCAFADGALKLCPSSHKQGRLRPEQIASHAARPFSSPEMKAGDILLMNPLTIHASGASQSLKPRRVIHIVYAAEGLRSMLSPRRA